MKPRRARELRTELRGTAPLPDRGGGVRWGWVGRGRGSAKGEPRAQHKHGGAFLQGLQCGQGRRGLTAAGQLQVRGAGRCAPGIAWQSLQRLAAPRWK